MRISVRRVTRQRRVAKIIATFDDTGGSGFHVDVMAVRRVDVVPRVAALSRLIKPLRSWAITTYQVACSQSRLIDSRQTFVNLVGVANVPVFKTATVTPLANAERVVGAANDQPRTSI